MYVILPIPYLFAYFIVYSFLKLCCGECGITQEQKLEWHLCSVYSQCCGSQTGFLGTHQRQSYE